MGGKDEIPTRTDSKLKTGNGIRISYQCSGGKICKNPQGLKIHQVRMKCLEREQQPQRAGDKTGRTWEKQSQQANHRALILQANLAQSSGIASRRRIKWPHLRIEGNGWNLIVRLPRYLKWLQKGNWTRD